MDFALVAGLAGQCSLDLAASDVMEHGADDIAAREVHRVAQLQGQQAALVHGQLARGVGPYRVGARQTQLFGTVQRVACGLC